MKKVQHPSNNSVLEAPTGMTIEQCSALAVTRIEYTGENNLPGIRSYWKPTEEELNYLNSGAFVMLEILGTTMPPVYIGVEK